MNAHRSLWLALPLALLLPVGCNNAVETGQEPESPAVAAAADTAAPTAQAATAHHHGRHHARGTAHMMLRAARKLNLSDTQRATVESLSTSLRGNRAAGESGRVAMRTALAAGVRAGNVDVSGLAPLQAPASTAREARREREITALNGLWAALQPAQRTALVASVQEKQAERVARWAGHEKSAGGRADKRLAHLTAKLGLDADQQQAVSTIMAANRPAPGSMQTFRTEMKARNQALLTAFSSESFDASQLPAIARPAGAGMGPAHHAQFLAKLVPILRTDQRETLAESIEARHD